MLPSLALVPTLVAWVMRNALERWQIVRLGEVAVIQMGQAPSSDFVSTDRRDMPFIQGSAEFGAHSPVSYLTCSRPPRTCATGDLLVSVRAPVGELNIADRDYAIGRGLAAVRFTGLESGFGYHALRLGAPLLCHVAQGSTFDAISKFDLAALSIAAPSSRSEQRRVARILTEVDDQINLTSSILDKQEFILKGLTITLLVPDGHDKLPLGDLATIDAGLTLGAEPEAQRSVELPYLRVANVQDGHIDTTRLKTVRVLRNQVERFKLKVDDVLLTEGGDFDKLGRGAVWDGRLDPCLYQNHIFRVRCRAGFLHPEYLALYTGSPAGRRYFLSMAKQSTNLASINSTQLKAMPISLPDLMEQERLVAPMLACRARIAAEWARLEKLRLLKQGLADDLLSGTVQVAHAVDGLADL